MKFTEISFLLQQQIYLSEKLGKKEKVQKCMKLFNQRFGFYNRTVENQFPLNRETLKSFLVSTGNHKIRKEEEEKQNLSTHLKTNLLQQCVEPFIEAESLESLTTRRGRSDLDLLVFLQTKFQKKAFYYLEGSWQKKQKFVIDPLQKKDLPSLCFNTLQKRNFLTSGKTTITKKMILPQIGGAFLEERFLNSLDLEFDRFLKVGIHFYNLSRKKMSELFFFRTTTKVFLFSSNLELLSWIRQVFEKTLEKHWRFYFTHAGHTLFSFGGAKSGLIFGNFEIQQYLVGADSKNVGVFKTRIAPTKESLKTHLSNLKNIFGAFKSDNQEILIRFLTKKIRSWCSYYKICSDKKSFFYLDRLLFQMLWRWACRRHSKKSRRWIKNRYFHSLNGKNWVFGAYQKESKQFICLPFHSETCLETYEGVDLEVSFYDF